MLRNLPAILVILFASPAFAQSSEPRCGSDDRLPALVQCTAEAASMLPPDKQAAVREDILRMGVRVAGSGGEISPPPERDRAYPDFGWQSAKSLLEQGGPDDLLQAGREKSGAMRFGRAEALLAAGIRAAGYSQDDAAARALASEAGLAQRINDELMRLAGTAGEFERGDLAHAAAQLAAFRCDAETFRQARQRTVAPEALRYDFWAARVSSDRSGLPQAIMTAASDSDTTAVRQALEGIGFLADHGLCPSSSQP